MTVKLASLRADLNREAEGDWVDFPDWPGVRFNVCSLQTPAYRVARDLAIQKLTRKYGRKPIPPEEQSSVFGRLYATHILRGWDGLDEPYSTERAQEVLLDPAYREVVTAVEWCAARLGEVEVDYVEKTAGNSPTVSATT